MTQNTSLQAALGLSTPIIQAPMAGVATSELAAAVCQAGGMGSLGLGSVDAESARAAIREARALGATCLNANFFCHQPELPDQAVTQAWLDAMAPEFARFDALPPTALREIYQSFLSDPARIEMLTQERPTVVSLHFGLPEASTLATLKGAGITLFASATNTSEARACIEAGIDAIVLQGDEAGGHRGCFDPEAADEHLSTLDLLKRIRPLTDLPLIAAGGMMDGSDCAHALNAGADLVQLGTAFILCPETSADAGYRAALTSDAANNTEFTRALSGRPARALPNTFTAWGATNGLKTPGYPHTYDAGKALMAAAKAKGDTSYGAHWAGSGAARVRAMPAAELVATLTREMRECR
ncbi:nitronate monooxygenase family protein [Thalassobius sp. Cn5-15]|uniref:NAD(P)H-dependent flavin oxidoreductase n=1 Tax=Thalassobius sp. Cn5-15 TaxID=2917763 RepID=UPI001EF22DD5|nr:nitronate monooxygenase family protein [Thalassobius sp. Cn5-15]MCG7494799.1 nitronate monooxygenase family protein [Thalassobius sp. Cn5-15]